MDGGIISGIFKGLGNIYNNSKQQKKDKFINIIEPVMKNMEIVHQKYLSNFTEYLGLIDESYLKFNKNDPLMNKIFSDSIIASDYKEQVYSFYDNSDDTLFLDFSRSIIKYFKSLYEDYEIPEDVSYYDINSFAKSKSLNSSIYRGYLFKQIYLRTIWGGTIEDQRENSKDVILDLIETLKYRYRPILDSFNQLKIECFK